MLGDALRQPEDGAPLGPRRAVPDHRATLQSLTQPALLHGRDLNVVFCVLFCFSPNSYTLLIEKGEKA